METKKKSKDLVFLQDFYLNLDDISYWHFDVEDYTYILSRKKTLATNNVCKIIKEEYEGFL